MIVMQTHAGPQLYEQICQVLVYALDYQDTLSRTRVVTRNVAT